MTAGQRVAVRGVYHARCVGSDVALRLRRHAWLWAWAAACLLALPAFARAQPVPPAQSGAPVGAQAPDDAAPLSPKVPQISQNELLNRSAARRADVTILDVRTRAEFAAGHVPGAINIPHDELPARIDELGAARDREVVVYCRTGRRSKTALHTLTAAGFTQLRHLEGDYTAWDAAKRPIEKSPSDATEPAAPQSSKPENAKP